MGRNKARFPTDPCPTSLHLTASTSTINPYLLLQLPLPHTPHHNNIPLSSLDPPNTIFSFPLCAPNISDCNEPSPLRTCGLQEAPHAVTSFELCKRSLHSQPWSLAAGRAKQKGCELIHPHLSFRHFCLPPSPEFSQFLGEPEIFETWCSSPNVAEALLSVQKLLKVKEGRQTYRYTESFVVRASFLK